MVDITSPRSPRISRTEMTEVVFPHHANRLGTAFGGAVMAWMDICGAIVANRHTAENVVTAAVDDLTFVEPIHVGDIVRLRGRINAAFRTSIEVEVTVDVEVVGSTEERRCVEACFTFVAVDSESRPIPVPPLRIETAEDAERERAAQERRKTRLEQKAAKQG